MSSKSSVAVSRAPGPKAPDALDVRAILSRLVAGEDGGALAVEESVRELKRRTGAIAAAHVRLSPGGAIELHGVGLPKGLDAEAMRELLADAELAMKGVDEARALPLAVFDREDRARTLLLQPVLRTAERIETALAILVDGRRDIAEAEQAAFTTASSILFVAEALAESQRLVKEQSDRFAQLARSIPGVVYQRVVRPDGDIRYVYISESAEELFGVPAQRIIEDPTALFANYSAEYSKKFRKKLIEASRKLTTWDVEAEIRKPDGTTRYTHAIAKPQLLQDGSVLWTGVILDASRIKEAERAAARAEERTRRAIVESLANGFLMFDADDELKLSNSRFHELYKGLDAEIRAGATYREVIAAELQREWHEARSDNALRARLNERLDLHAGGADFVLERRIGKDLWVQINERRTPEGNTVVIYTDVSEMRRREERMHHMALHDALTGLPNRVLFRSRLEQALLNADRYGGQVAVIAIDLDNFKHVNDTLGHPAGDRLLQHAVERIQGCIRETDTLARLGGDEFALIIPEILSPKSADSVSLRMIDVLGKPFEIDGQIATVGASIGIAISDGDNVDPDGLIKQADLALYRAKSDNKNCHRFFAKEMDERAQARRMLELELRDALTKDELVLHFQPQIDSESGGVRGFEALVRWDHPTRGLIGPGGFIEVAEETGFIVPLGAWVVRKACAVAAAWPVPAIVAVNVSPAQLKRMEFVKVVDEALRETRLDPARLELEVTETVFLRDTNESLEILYALKRLGVRIAMDDFGTGYSSLANLRRFPFDKIKIDRSFVADLSGSAEAAAIIKAVVDMGRTMKIETTAEGVETDEQAQHLRDEGCTQLQGFLYSKPRPAAEVSAMLEEQARRRWEKPKNG